MAKHKSLLALILTGVCVCGAFFLSSFNTQSQDIRQTPDQAENVDTSKYPVAELFAPLPLDPKERTKRQAKGKRYNNKGFPKLQSVDSSYRVNDSLGQLPALPIEKSSVIILGEVKDAKAYLSEDETTIYSEFVVSIQSVLKNETGRELNGSVEVERYGGRLRLPSGKIIVEMMDHQEMPRVGAKYVLFLNGENEDAGLTILAGYELREGKVFPLDQTLPTHPMAGYKLQDEATLLNDLLLALATSPAARG